MKEGLLPIGNLEIQIYGTLLLKKATDETEFNEAWDNDIEWTILFRAC